MRTHSHLIGRLRAFYSESNNQLPFHCVLGFLSGGMNSWFYHEFTVFSMGSISANIMNYMGKLIMAMWVMVLGSGITAPFGIHRLGARGYQSAHRRSGLSYDVVWVVFCVFASVKLAKREPTGMDRPWRPPSSHGRHGPPLTTRPHATPSFNIVR